MTLRETLDAPGVPVPTATIFLCQPDLIDDAQLLACYEALLDATERSRLARFHFRRDAHTFLVAHALVRTALSQFADVDPSQWKFRTNRFGRPSVDAPADSIAPRFNLSHCHGLIACMVTVNDDCGVDVEKIQRFGDLLGVASRYFSRSEAASLRACPEEMTAPLFYYFWTLKEAYIKARAMGLSMPLDEFSFSFAGDRIAVCFNSDIEDRASDWTFVQLQPTPAHVLAAAMRKATPDAAGLLALRWWVPLRGPQPALPWRLVASSDGVEVVS